jgi:hypothetical protein
MEIATVTIATGGSNAVEDCFFAMCRQQLHSDKFVIDLILLITLTFRLFQQGLLLYLRVHNKNIDEVTHDNINNKH